MSDEAQPFTAEEIAHIRAALARAQELLERAWRAMGAAYGNMDECPDCLRSGGARGVIRELKEGRADIRAFLHPEPEGASDAP